MATAQDRDWGHPDEPGFRQRNIVAVDAGGVRLWVHRGVARLFKGFLDELVRRGYSLDVIADDWGYVNRDIRGRPGVKSNHAWGLAVDINATKNPMTEAHPSHASTAGHDERGVHTDMPRWVGPLAERWGLRWGANYSGTRKDAMHFEFMGTPVDVGRYPIDGEAYPVDNHQEEVLMLIQMEVSPTTVLVVPGVGPRSIDNWKTDVDGLKAKGVPHIIVSKVMFARIIRGHDIYGT